MKRLTLILISIVFLISCEKDQDSSPETNGGIYAITGIGVANKWRICKLNEVNWDFELIGDTIKLGGFAYGASTKVYNRLIVYTGQSLKHTDLNEGKLMKEVLVGKFMYGLESPGNNNFIYSMTGSSFNNSYFSIVNIENGEITTLSDFRVESVLSKSPSTLIVSSSSYYIYGKNNSRQIFCFDTNNGNLKNEIPISGSFPLHRIDGLEYNKQNGLIYYIENKEDGKWKLMTLNSENNQLDLFLDDIDLLYNINSMVLDSKNQKYLIQNHSSSADTVLTIIDLKTKQINTHPNSSIVIEMNEI